MLPALASPPAVEPPAATLLGVTYPDHSGWPGCGNPQHRIAREGARESDSSWTLPDPPSTCTATPLGTRTSIEPHVCKLEVDLMDVPAGSGEIEPGRPEAGVDGRVGRQLPAGAQLQSAVWHVKHQRAGQPLRGRCEPYHRGQRQHRCLELGVAGSGEDLVNDGREALDRQSPVADQLMQPGNGRATGVFVNPLQKVPSRDCSRSRQHLGPRERDKQAAQSSVGSIAVPRQCRRSISVAAARCLSAGRSRPPTALRRERLRAPRRGRSRARARARARGRHARVLEQHRLARRAPPPSPNGRGLPTEAGRGSPGNRTRTPSARSACSWSPVTGGEQAQPHAGVSVADDAVPDDLVGPRLDELVEDRGGA